MPNEELQKGCNRKDENERRYYHRALASKRAVVSRAPSGTLEKVYAHASGSHVPISGGTHRRTDSCKPGKRFRRAYVPAVALKYTPSANTNWISRVRVSRNFNMA